MSVVPGERGVAAIRATPGGVQGACESGCGGEGASRKWYSMVYLVQRREREQTMLCILTDASPTRLERSP